MAQNLSDAANVLAPTGQTDDSYFNTERLKTGLGARAARGGAVTIASQGFKFFAGLGTTMVLGRLLTPADYGLIGMVAVVTGFVSMFKDLGLSAATVQRDHVRAGQHVVLGERCTEHRRWTCDISPRTRGRMVLRQTATHSNHGSLRSWLSLWWADSTTRSAVASPNAFSCSSSERAHRVACDDLSNHHSCMAWLGLLGARRRSYNYELRLHALHLDGVQMEARAAQACFECNLAAPLRWKPHRFRRSKLLRA